MANTKITSNVIADNAVGISALNVSDGSDGQVLTTNGSGTLSFATVSGTTINNNADNRIITGSGTANTLNGESGLTFDGTNLGIGASTVDAKLHIEVSSGDANLKLEDGSATYMLLDQNSIGGSDVVRFKSGSNLDERMRIDSSGNVIVGGTSPLGAGKLSIDSSGACIIGADTDAASGGYIQWLAGGTAKALLGFGSNAGAGSINNVALRSQSGDLEFHTNGANERMRINSSGQTLINTTDGNMPTAGGNAPCVIYGGAGNGFADNALHVGGGRISLNAQPNSNSTRGYIECSGAGFKLFHVDNSDFIIGVNNLEKFRINWSSGRIRNIATYNNTAPATHRDVYVENNGDFGYASSVRAHKTNINSYGDASWLYSIDPKTFNYRKPNTTVVTNDDGFETEVRDGTYSDTEHYDTVEVGFIAEDIEEHDANLCFYNEVEDEDGNVTNELAGVHYKSMVVPMLKLIKEQKILIDNLTTRIETLEG